MDTVMVVEQIDDITAEAFGKYITGAVIGSAYYLFAATGAHVLDEEPETDRYEDSSVKQRLVQNIPAAVLSDGFHDSIQYIHYGEVPLYDDVFVGAGAHNGYTTMREIYRYGQGVDSITFSDIYEYLGRIR